MVFLICVGIAAYGVMKNLREGESFNSCHVVMLNFLAGLCATVMLVGIVMKSGGSTGVTGMIIGGLIGTIVFQIKDIKEAMELTAHMKAEKTECSGKTKFQLSPLGAWLNGTLIGLGKVGKLVMYFTLIGIPLYRIIENSTNEVDAYAEQVKLREEKQAMEEVARLNRIEREARKDFEKRQAEEAAKKAKETEQAQNETTKDTVKK